MGCALQSILVLMTWTGTGHVEHDAINKHGALSSLSGCDEACRDQDRLQTTP